MSSMSAYRISNKHPFIYLRVCCLILHGIRYPSKIDGNKAEIKNAMSSGKFFRNFQFPHNIDVDIV